MPETPRTAQIPYKVMVKSPKKGNVFTQIADWRAKRAESLTESEVNHAASMRSDKTNADEAKLWVSLVLGVVTIITAYLAMQYYQDVFQNTFSEYATVLAVALAIVVEIGKIKLALRALHSVLFGWMFESGATLGYWGFIWLLAIGAFFWSVRVSTQGLTRYSANHAESTVSKDSLAPLLAAATAAIDQQINAETASRTDAQGNKWKNTTVVISSRQAKKNTENIAKLQEQRQAVVNQTIADYKDGLSKRTGKINAFTYFITEFGGYMEIIAGLCILAIAFFNYRLVEISVAAHALLEEPDTPTLPEQASPNERPVRQHNGQEVHNKVRPIGFNVDRNGNIPVSQPKPVIQLYHNVSQPKKETGALGADAIITTYRTKLYADINNLEKGNGVKSTIAGRIHSYLNTVGRAMGNEEFEPSDKLATDFFFYMQDTVFPTLIRHNVRYSNDNWFLETLEQFVPATAFAKGEGA